MNHADARGPHIVIVGAGFGGLWAAKTLAPANARITLIDKNNYHTFLPLLYQVAAAELEPELIVQSIRRIVRGQRNLRVIMAEIQRIDLGARVVYGNGQAIPYDYLIVALGSTVNYFGTPGAAEHSFTLKSVDEGIALRNHILSCVEKAATLPADAVEERRRLLSFVIIGGGPTGVEYAGALAELLYMPLSKDFPELNLRQEARVILIEALDDLLQAVGGGDYARERLQAMGVEVRLGTKVTAITERAVRLADGTELATASAVWTAGVRGATLTDDLPLPRVRGGRIPVRPTLQTPEDDRVFVIGDLAYLEQDGSMLPGVAQVAMQQGVHAAHNVMRQVAGKSLLPFQYKDKGAMATIGRNAAVARFGDRLYTGFVAWVMWLVVHVFFLVGFRNRITVLLNWAWNYVFYERVVRLILPNMAPTAPQAPATAPAVTNGAAHMASANGRHEAALTGEGAAPAVQSADRP